MVPSDPFHRDGNKNPLFLEPPSPYRAPELCGGDYCFNEAVDAWSLGVLVLEMLGGTEVVPARLQNDGEGLAWALRGLGRPVATSEAPAGVSAATTALSAAPAPAWDATLSRGALGDTARALLVLEPDSRMLVRAAAARPGLVGYSAMPPILTNAPGDRGLFSLMQTPLDMALLEYLQEDAAWGELVGKHEAAPGDGICGRAKMRPHGS